MRTLSDIADVCAATGKNSDFRICKGIYLEPENIAHTKYWDIVHATNDAIDAMLDSGAYTAIASHDNPVIAYSLAALKSRDMGPDKPDPRHTESPNLCSGKVPVMSFNSYSESEVMSDANSPSKDIPQVYVPYGTKWYEYSIAALERIPKLHSM